MSSTCVFSNIACALVLNLLTTCGLNATPVPPTSPPEPMQLPLVNFFIQDTLRYLRLI